MKKFLAYVFIIYCFDITTGCKRDYGCTSFPDDPPPPYTTPAWHPNGQILGFNRLPLKAVATVNQGACGSYYTYSYYNDSIGFWLINRDGSNLRRATTFQLLDPAWSPDGKWIAFCNGGTIYKMPFDGYSFDTTHIIILTSNGAANFFPSWSPSGDTIYFDSNVENTSKAYRVHKMAADGGGQMLIGNKGKDSISTRSPYCTADNEILHFRIDTDYVTKQVFIMNANGDSVRQITTNINNVANSQKGFARYYNGKIYFEDFGVWCINADGTGLQQLFSQSAQGFSIAKDGTIAYINYNYKILDKTHGVIWLMDSNGNNQRQLTFNYPL